MNYAELLNKYADDSNKLEHITERAAIREFHGGMDRDTAERLTAQDWEEYDQLTLFEEETGPPELAF